MGQGYGVDTATGTPTYKTDESSVYSKVLWNVSDDTQVRLGLNYQHKGGAGMDAQIVPGHMQLNGQPSDVAPYNTNANFPDHFSGTAYLAWMKVDHRFTFGNLESISAYRTLPFPTVWFDDDVSPAALINAIYSTPTRTFTQEVRLLSPDESLITWVAGVYYFHSIVAYDPIYLSGLGIGATPINEFDEQRNDATAGYGQVTVPLAYNTKLTGGVRFNDEELQHAGTRVESPLGSVVAQAGSEANNEKTWSWRGALDHQFTQQIMAYVSANRGFKEGGYNLLSTPGFNIPAYKPEKLTAYEAGLKTTMFDRRVRLNGAAYYYSYENIQVESSIPGGTIVQNGPKATFKGIDADLDAYVLDNLQFQTSVNYVEGHYGEFQNAIAYPENPFLGTFLTDATGNTTIRTPRWSGSAGFNYEVYSAVGKFAFNVNANFMTKVFVAADNRLTVPGYTVTNGSVEYTPSSGKYSVRGWILNMTNKEYLNTRLETGTGDWQLWAPPRTYGITLSVYLGS